MKLTRILLTLLILASTLAPVFSASFGLTGQNEAYVLMNDLALWKDEWGGSLKWLENIPVGDKVQLLGKTGKFKLEGREREYTRVKTLSGKEGWVRSNYIATNASLAVIKADKAIVYAEPRDIKVTSNIISNMTIVAVFKDGKTDSFIKVTAYDPIKDSLSENVFISADDITSAEIDINAVVMYRVAMSQKSADIKKNLLTVASTKYGKTIFIDKINQVLNPGSAPATVASAPRATKAATGIYVVNDKNVNVRTQPDEKNSSVSTMIQKGTEVEILETTTETYTVGNQTAAWFRIKEPTGWVFGVFLDPKP